MVPHAMNIDSIGVLKIMKFIFSFTNFTRVMIVDIVKYYFLIAVHNQAFQLKTSILQHTLLTHQQIEYKKKSSLKMYVTKMTRKLKE